LLNQNVELTDYTLTIMGLTCFFEDRISSPEGCKLDNVPSTLPWDKEFYEEQTPVKIYTKNNLPKGFKKFQEKCEEKNLFLSEINYKITIQEYAPKVFQHIRNIDTIQNNIIKLSIDPKKTIDHLTHLREMCVNGGNSGNLVIYTYDHKFLVKTISTEELETFVEFLPQYHKIMRSFKTLLCRIYGLYKIQIQDKNPSYIIIMKNMLDLTQEVNKLIIIIYRVKLQLLT